MAKILKWLASAGVAKAREKLYRRGEKRQRLAGEMKIMAMAMAAGLPRKWRLSWRKSAG